MFINGALYSTRNLLLMIVVINLCATAIGQEIAFQEVEEDDPNRKNANVRNSYITYLKHSLILCIKRLI